MDGEGDEVPNNKWSPDQKSLPPVTQTIKNVPAMQVSWVQSLGWEDSPGKGSGYPLQYFCLENSMHRGVCWLQSMESQGVRDDWNSDSFIWLPWWLRWQRICLQCWRPGFNPWVGKIPWRREWQSTPVFLPGEFHGQGSLDGYHPWGLRLDVTEWLTYTHKPKWIIHHNSCGISPDS